MEEEEENQKPLTPALSPQSGEREEGVGAEVMDRAKNPTLRGLSVGVR